MILFKPHHIDLILQGRKTQTRRLWSRWRVRDGSVHACKTKLFGNTIVRVKVVRRWVEKLGDISDVDAQAEGYTDAAAYLEEFDRINGVTPRDTEVRCVEFRLADQILSGIVRLSPDTATGG